MQESKQEKRAFFLKGFVYLALIYSFAYFSAFSFGGGGPQHNKELKGQRAKY